MSETKTPEPKVDDPRHSHHGVPDGADDAEPTGLPDSGRHQTETVPGRS